MLKAIQSHLERIQALPGTGRTRGPTRIHAPAVCSKLVDTAALSMIDKETEHKDKLAGDFQARGRANKIRVY